MEWNFQAFQFLNVLFSLMALSQYYITSKSPGLTNKQTNKQTKQLKIQDFFIRIYYSFKFVFSLKSIC